MVRAIFFVSAVLAMGAFVSAAPSLIGLNVENNNIANPKIKDSVKDIKVKDIVTDNGK
jgi:hypothetical protein